MIAGLSGSCGCGLYLTRTRKFNIGAFIVTYNYTILLEGVLISITPQNPIRVTKAPTFVPTFEKSPDLGSSGFGVADADPKWFRV